MNKNIITGLIVLMGISILGIIGVQLVWMNNAIRVKNELFERGVNDALHNTVNKLENRHNFEVVNQLAFDEEIDWIHDFDEEFDLDHNMEIHVKPDNKKPHSSQSIHKAPREVKIIREINPRKKDATVEIELEADTNRKATHNSFRYKISTNTMVNTDPIIIDECDDEDELIVLRKDTIITAPESLYGFSMIKIDSVLTKLELDTSFTFVQPNFSLRAKQKASKLRNIANRAVSEIYMWDIKEIDYELLQEVLKTELENKNIPIDFDYGIKHDSITEFPVPVKDSAKVVQSGFQIDLYPNDIIQKNIKLALFFPNRDSFIYRSLNWLMIASLLFSLFILATFSLSVYYILRQKKISEMKSDFINNMTHEFKTPIATISVASDSITNEKVVNDPERIKYFAGMIKKENTRMNRQVEDILTIARLDRKDFEFNWEAINVHDLINDAIQGIILQIEKQGGKIKTNLEAKNAMITTDRMHCTNVIYNLLDNAIKYSSDAPEITVTTTNMAKGVLVSVNDKGIGMTKAVQGKIFERFYRQTSGNVHNVKGFGLGLSYVKAVLEANRGTISVQSEQDKGSKFDVFLPFVRE